MMVMAVVGMAMIGYGSVLVQHPPVRQMGVVVIVSVDGKCLRRARAQKCAVFGARCHGLGCAAAAHMAVEADHCIGRGHH